MQFKRNKILIGVVLSVIIFFLTIFLFTTNSNIKKFKVERKKMVLSVYASGYIDSSDSVTIRSEVSGYVEKILIRENQEVKKGQILAVISHKVLSETLKEVEANLSMIEDRLKSDSDFRREQLEAIEIKKSVLENIQRNFFRKKALYEEELISKENFDNATKEYEVAKRDYERQIRIYNDAIKTLNYQKQALKAKKQALIHEIDKYYIRAPIDGKILRKFVNQGDYVSNLQANNLLFSIGNQKNLETVLMVDEEFIPLIKEGMKVIVTVDSYPNQSFIGKIKTIESQSERTSRTVKVKADIEYTKPVIFNLTVEANIIIKETEGIFIPVSAYKDGYVEIWEHGKTKTLRVEVAPERYNGFLLVISGLKEGQEVLIR